MSFRDSCNHYCYTSDNCNMLARQSSNSKTVKPDQHVSPPDGIQVFVLESGTYCNLRLPTKLFCMCQGLWAVVGNSISYHSIVCTEANWRCVRTCQCCPDTFPYRKL
uniref:Uncharacterized protein n=2 Tax=Micrurus TaxID=8634 RepID=A0A2D4JW83_9SAUR